MWLHSEKQQQKMASFCPRYLLPLGLWVISSDLTVLIFFSKACNVKARKSWSLSFKCHQHKTASFQFKNETWQLIFQKCCKNISKSALTSPPWQSGHWLYINIQFYAWDGIAQPITYSDIYMNKLHLLTCSWPVDHKGLSVLKTHTFRNKDPELLWKLSWTQWRPTKKNNHPWRPGKGSGLYSAWFGSKVKYTHQTLASCNNQS